MSFGWADGSFGMVEATANDRVSLQDRFSNRMDLHTSWLDTGRRRMEDGSCSSHRSDRKENVVATFGMLFGFAEVAEDGAEIWGNLAQVMTPIAAYGFLVFNLLMCSCFAAMGAIKREMNNTKWFWFAIGYQCGLAYIVSLCIYQIGTLFTSVMKTVTTVQENAGDIYAEAQQINEDRKAQETSYADESQTEE